MGKINDLLRKTISTVGYGWHVKKLHDAYKMNCEKHVLCSQKENSFVALTFLRVNHFHSEKNLNDTTRSVQNWHQSHQYSLEDFIINYEQTKHTATVNQVLHSLIWGICSKLAINALEQHHSTF